MNIKSLIISLLIVSTINARVTNHRFDHQETLALPLTQALQDQNFKRVRAYLMQADNWSCGLRCAFHAIAFEKALKNPQNFEQELKTNLQNSQLLDELDRKYGNGRGLTNEHIKIIAQDYGFGNKLACFLLDKTNHISYCGKYSYSYPRNASKQQIENIKNQAIKESFKKTVNNLIDNVKRAPQASYFVAGSENHWILFALVHLPNKPVSLYLIDSNNRGIEGGRKEYISFLLPYVASLNSNIQPLQIAPAPQKQPIKPAIALNLARNIQKAKAKAQKVNTRKKKPQPKKNNTQKRKRNLNRAQLQRARLIWKRISARQKKAHNKNKALAYALYKKHQYLGIHK